MLRAFRLIETGVFWYNSVMLKLKNKTRIIAGVTLFFLMAQLLEVPLVQAAPLVLAGSANNPVAQDADKTQPSVAKNHIGIIAVLVDQNLMADGKNYSTTISKYADKLTAKTLAERIRRYAIDAEFSQEFTKSTIIKIDPQAKVENIASMLEKLYQEGDGTANEINKLTGIVTIGDVPLPVVNKKGNHFVSMLPYTDFEDKVYIFDAKSKQYVRNPDLKFPKAEVWHGVIKPPVGGEDGKQLLADYFDKNHLFHLGVSEYSDFEHAKKDYILPNGFAPSVQPGQVIHVGDTLAKEQSTGSVIVAREDGSVSNVAPDTVTLVIQENHKLLMADLFNEFKSMNIFGFGNYLRYLNHAEDFSYLRFNKHLAEQFFNEINAKLKDEGIELNQSNNCDKGCVIAKNGLNQDFDGDGYTNGYELFVGAKSPNGNTPTDPKNGESVPLDLTQPGGQYGFKKRTNPDPKTYTVNDDGSKLYFPDPPIDANNPGSAFATLPDIQSKQLIMNFVSKYVQLFDKFLATSNDWTKSTGRYDPAYQDGNKVNKSDLHTLPLLISEKDDYATQYLRLVNDALEKKIDDIIEGNKLYNDVTLIQNSIISGDISLDNDPLTYSLDNVDFVNSNDLHFINGTPMSALQSVAECSLYRGSDDGTGKNSTLVKGIQTLNPKTAGKPSDNTAFAGCYGNNYGHPERCFASRATAPVSDVSGTKEADPATTPAAETDYRSCFDFKEKSYYQNWGSQVDAYLQILDSLDNEDAKKTVPVPGSSYKPANQIFLYSGNAINNVKVSLADVLAKFGLGDGVDNDGDGVIDNFNEGDPKYGIPTNDWQQIGERLLKKDKTFIFNNNPFPGVTSLSFKVQTSPVQDNASPSGIKQLKSIVYHKDPTNDVISKQLANGASMSLPIDNPHYVTFQDKSGGYQKLVYPNVFGAQSYDEFVQLLKYKEAELQAIVTASGVNMDVTGILSNVVNSTIDQFDAANKSALKRANAEELKDAINWRTLGIDDKHQYVLEKYIGKDGEPYYDKMVPGYEALYLVSKGAADSFQMRFNGDYPESDPGVPPAPPETPATEQGLIGGGNGGAGASSSGSGDGVDFFKWFQHILDWIKDTQSKITAGPTFAPACMVPGSEGDAGGSAPAQPGGINVPGPDKTAKLVLSSESKVLQADAGNTLTITVEGQSLAGVLQSGDSQTMVDLVVSKSGGKVVATIGSNHPTPLINGKATFNLQSTGEVGNFTVKATSSNKPQLSSNSLFLSSVKGKIRLVSYVRSDDLQYGQELGSALVIQNEQNEMIAEVNSDTGMITILDDRYQLVVLASKADKPVRLAVQEKASQQIVASEFFVSESSNGVSIDDASMNYVSKYTSLVGTHVKDVLPNDSVTVEKTGSDASLYAVNGGAKKKIGLVDAVGNIFLDAGYGLQLKPASSSADPVVFEVINAQASILFEVYIAVKLPTIQIVAPENGFEKMLVASENARNLVFDHAESQPIFLKGVLTLPFAHAEDASTTNAIPDSDQDGINDLEEIIIGTNPLHPDTDSDGYKDGEELAKGYDPIKPNAPLFQDLNPQAQGFADIVRLYKRGIVKGYSDGNFKPDQTITREEFTKLDLGSICLNCTKFRDPIKQSIDAVYNNNPFPDTNFTSDLLYCVKESKNRGIISGYGSGPNLGLYVPKSSISRTEATKVILETTRQQNLTSIQFLQYPLEGKPWYYNYVLTAQAEHLYPVGRFYEVDKLDPESFKTWFDTQLGNSQNPFIQWLESSITRREFAMMVSQVINKTDCYLNDQDGDFLPDNFEKYVFGTDQTNADTDNGGVKDLTELVRNTNVFDPKDDNANFDDDQDGMPSAWEVQYKLNPYNPADASQDPDGDFLTNLDEYHYETNPLIADTDEGGVNDGDEVLRGTNPLEKTDDLKSLQTQAGAYLVGAHVSDHYDIATQDASNATSTSSINYLDEIPADGKSKLFLRAELLDDQGNVLKKDNNSVIVFQASKKNSGDYATIKPSYVKVKEGVAETEITSTLKAGEFVATAEVKNASIPIDEKSLFIVPLDPAKITLSADSPIIKNGGLSTTLIHANLEDANGNLENNGSFQMTFTAQGPGVLDATKDEDAAKDGVQITSVTGKFDLLLTSSVDAGNVTVYANYESLDDAGNALPPVQSSLQVQSRDDLHIGLKVIGSQTIPSDFKTVTAVEASVLDSNNQVVENFGGTAKFALLQSSLGQLIGAPEAAIIKGKANIIFQSSNLAGEAPMSVTIQGFEPQTIAITTTPKASRKIILEASEDQLESDPNATVKITGKLYDTDNNFASNDSTSIVKFELTDATKKFGTLEGTNPVKANNGVVNITLRANQFSGPLNLVASSNGFVGPASLSLQSTRTFHAETLRDISPRVLFGSLLGSAFGNIFQDNYVGGWFLFAPKSTTQSALSLLSEPKPFLQLLNIDTTGKLNIFDPDGLKVRVVPGNSATTPNQIVVTDTLTKKDQAQMFVLMPPQSKATIAATDAAADTFQEGVYVQNSTTLTNYALAQLAGAVSVTKDGNEAVRIFNNGATTIYDNDFSLEYVEDASSNFLNVRVMDKGVEIATLTYASALFSNVNLLPKDFVFGQELGSFGSGVYVQTLSSKTTLQFQPTFSGNSTVMPQGMALVDTTQEMPQAQAPGLSYISLEAAPDEAGIGFKGDNKHMLLFAAGNSVGESNLPYSSEIGVVLGDPTVRINNKKDVSQTGFTKDIGKEIFTGDQPVKELTMLDYNSDGLNDILVSYTDGKIRLLQNNNSYPRFEDRGMYANFPNGILSMATADFNNDGQEDLMIASKESCRVGEVCIDLYENHHGNLVRKHLALQPFTEKNRVYMIRAGDMNNDGYPELVTSDDTGAIRVFYNRKGVLETQGKFVGTLGLHIDQNANLKTEVLVAYDNMPKNDSATTTDDDFFKELPVTKNTSALGGAEQGQLADIQGAGSNSIQVEAPTQDDKVAVPFIYLDADDVLATSEKRSKDATDPKDVLARGDEVQYTLTFKNSGASTLKNFMFSDVFPSNMSVDPAQIQCMDCSKNEKIQLMETGQSLRPVIIGGFSIPAGKSRTFTYKGTVKSTPAVKILLGQNLSPGSPQDNFLDIGAAPDGNTSGRMTYFVASGKDPKSGEINYQQVTSAPPDPNAISPNVQKILDALKPPTKESLQQDANDNGVPDTVEDQYNEPSNSDSDGDGLANAYDEFNKGLESVADTMQSVVNAFSCGQGCLPMPLNFAFLAPGAINAFGIPAGFDPGIAVFGWGLPTLPIVCSGPMCYGSLGGRIYASPTLTMSLGAGICVGPYLATPFCWALAVPPAISPLAAACDAISKGVSEALANANNAIQSAGNSAIFTSGETADSAGRQETGGMSGSTTLGNYQYKAAVSTNFSIPSFPAVITKWFEDQTKEIINKLTDLPDFYLVLPDPTSIITSVIPDEDSNQNGNSGQKDPFTFPTLPKSPLKDENGNWQVGLSSPSKILSYINSIPLIQIQTQEVGIKIPALTANQIAKLQNDSKQWVEDERAEVNRVLGLWCGNYQIDENWKKIETPGYQSPNQSICDKLLVNMTDFKGGVEKNLQVLEKYKELPRQILAWRNMFTKYIYQVICYIDTIMQVVTGHIQKLQKSVVAWIDTIRKIKEILNTWKLLLDLVIDFQASCDKCSSARFSLMELLLRVFAAIPSPPVIPFPKWPDIYFDLSQIQTGLKVLWPDVKFIPEQIILPKIPRITLPDVPTLTINLPQLPVLPDPPTLPELPDLPPIPVPELPDLPMPPKIPELMAELKGTISILKTILKILCLLKKGFLPIPEMSLKTQIESLTERPLTPLLPLDLGIKLQFPEIKYDYVDRVEVVGKLNFQLDFSAIQDVVQGVADDWNSISTDLVKQLNTNVKEAGAAAQAGASAATDAANKAVPQGNIDANLQTNVGRMRAENSQTMIDSAIFDINKISDAELESMLKEFEQSDPLLGKLFAEYQNANKQLDALAAQQKASETAFAQDLHLTATQKFLNPNDPRLNRTPEELKAQIASEGKPEFEVQKRLGTMRNSLIAYADQQNAVFNSIGDETNLEEVGRALAQLPALNDYLPQGSFDMPTKMVASTHGVPSENGAAGFSASSAKRSNLAENSAALFADDFSTITSVKNFGQEVQKHITRRLDLMASSPSIPDVPTTPGTSGTQIQDKGIYILNTDANINERLTNYTEEADQPTQLLFIDMDNDGDEEIVYSMGSNIYLKENYKKSHPATYLGYEPQVKELNDYLPSAPAVNGLRTNFENNNSVEMAWAKATYDDVSGYVLTYKLMPDAFTQNISPIAHQVATVIDTTLTLENLQGEVEVLPPTGAANSGSATPAQPVAATEGMVLEYGTMLKSKNGGTVRVRLGNGSYVLLQSGQDLLLLKLDAPENPLIHLVIPNGSYYARINSFDHLGSASTLSSTVLMSPSICHDKQAPLPNAGASERDVTIFKTLTIDASKSFDSDGKILEYFIDDDPSVDSDLDGDTKNDRNVGRDIDPFTDENGDSVTNDELNNPIFNLGPFTDLQDRTVVVNVLDEALNRSSQEITIHVQVPKITLDSSTATDGIIKGSIDPGEGEVPLTIIRDRNGVLQTLTTKTANPQGKYLTGPQGEFSVKDLNVKDTIVIKNEKGQVIGEIDPITSRVILKDANYHVEVLPAQMPLLPTRIVVKQNSDNKVITTLFLVPDLNTDVTLDPVDVPYNASTVALFKGVHSKDLDSFDDFAFNKIPADDANYPGGLEVVENSGQKRLAILDSGGNFYVLDNRLSLRLKDATDLSEPLIIQIALAEKILGEFHIALKPNQVHIVPIDKFRIFVEGAQTKGPLYDEDHDGMPDQWELIYHFNPKDSSDGVQDSDGDGLTNLEEYLAGSNPLNPDTNGDGFTDAQELSFGRRPGEKIDLPYQDVKKDALYYDDIFKLWVRRVFEGIPNWDKESFNPGANITRAEFADIMLKVFCILPRPEAYNGPSSFTDIPYEKGYLPWYYAKVKEAYFQGFVVGYQGEINKETGLSPFKPDANITRVEAAKVILEALERKGVIDMGQVPVTQPYYTPYLNMAQNLSPYVKLQSRIKEPYILTAEEAKQPEKTLTREEFIAMADRVLVSFDCTVIDDDRDGMPTFWEQKHGLNPYDASDAPKDPDKDELTNLNEYKHGTDPFNPDTDGGKVKDGVEVKKATNPLDGKDDPIDTDDDGLTDKNEENIYHTDPFNPDTDAGGVDDGTEVLINNTNPLNGQDDKDRDGDGLSDSDEINKHRTDPGKKDTDKGGVDDGTEVKRGTNPLDPKDDLIDPRSDLKEGIYVIQDNCLACPCPSSVDHTADLVPGDRVFSIISNYNNSEIFSKSNVIEVKEIPAGGVPNALVTKQAIGN